MTYEMAVKSAVEGKNEGFQFLYESTCRDKYYIALKYMKNEADAQDVLQDSYVKAFSRLNTLQDAEAFPSWLGQIVANTAKNALVKKKPLLFSEMNAETDSDEKWEEQIEDEKREYRPEEAYTKQEIQTIVHEMIDSLSDEQRICVLMYYLEEQSVRNIAEALECSENTVKSRLNYGRKNLKYKAEEMNKKGYKLYSIAPLPLLLYLLRSERDFCGIPQLFMWNTSPENSVNAANHATKGVGKSVLHTTSGKVMMAVLAFAVTGAVTAGIVFFHSSQEDSMGRALESKEEMQQDSTQVQEATQQDSTQVQEEAQQEATEPQEETQQDPVEVSKEQWIALYDEKLEEIKNSEDSYRASLPEWDQSADISFRFALCEMNGDDIPELVVSTAVNGWGTCAFYRVSKDGSSVEQIDTEEPIYDGAAATGGSRSYLKQPLETPGIYSVNAYSYSPDVEVYLYQLSGDKIVRTLQENYTAQSAEFDAFNKNSADANWADIQYSLSDLVGSE